MGFDKIRVRNILDAVAHMAEEKHSEYQNPGPIPQTEGLFMISQKLHHIRKAYDRYQNGDIPKAAYTRQLVELAELVVYTLASMPG